MKQTKNNEVVVITGAGAGVGRATVREFAKHGAHMGLLSRGEDRLEAARKEVAELGGKALPCSVDVADPEQVENAAEKIEAEFGPIDVWVNVAMTTVFSPFHEITPEEFKRVTEVTYLGNVNGTLAALKRMRSRDRGTIVQVGSALAYRPVPLQSAYCGAKHAIKGYTEALRSELLHAGSGVHVTIVEMPALNTPQFDWCKNNLSKKARPVAPVYQPEIAARAIYWAAHHRRRQLYVGFSTVKAIWGNKFIPGLLDRYLGRTAIGGQQADEAADPNRAYNLWEPVAGDPGAHGRFDDEAQARSFQLWLATHLPWR
ncbi:MAG: SDR family oxidoreductase [Gammaproteobacteria bacterium]